MKQFFFHKENQIKGVENNIQKANIEKWCPKDTFQEDECHLPWSETCD